jgi:hypothetical protein
LPKTCFFISWIYSSLKPLFWSDNLKGSAASFSNTGAWVSSSSKWEVYGWGLDICWEDPDNRGLSAWATVAGLLLCYSLNWVFMTVNC